MQSDQPCTAWLRPRVLLCGRSWSTFQVCGLTGLLLGTALGLWLARRSGLVLWPIGCLLLASMGTFVLLVYATKLVTGTEVLIYYHHEIAILGVSSLLLMALGFPVLPYLDVTCLGLGIFLACGRVGCLMVGCCFGRPHRWGLRYCESHEAEGFPACLVRVPLLPVQAIESIAVLCIVAVASTAILRGSPAGTALADYVVIYAAARVWLEELRGDDARRYVLKLSEAQWTSLVLTCLLLWGEWRQELPAAGWHFGLGAASAACLGLLACTRTGRRAVLHPRHACELAAIVRCEPSAEAAGITVRRTSLRIGVSMQRLARGGSADAMLYSLSRADRSLTALEAGALARLIALFAIRPVAQTSLLRGRRGVFHLIVHGTPAPRR